jgi:hypothetical protein
MESDMATDTTITISRGDDWESILTFLVDGDALDVRGAYLWFTAKVNKDDADADAVITPASTRVHISSGADTEGNNAALGIYHFNLSNTLTNIAVGTYYYDFQLLDTANKVKTLGSGKLKIVQDITQTIATT